MKFSILVPVYNVEKYLEQCVESLLNQTYEGAYEIILVDDGSTDSSGAICDGYAAKHPEKVRVIHKKNEGLVSARQAGINAATGEFCLFVDSDDYVELCLLEAISDSLKKHTDADIFVFSLNRFDDKKISPRKAMIDGEDAVFCGDNKKTVYEALIMGSQVTSLCVKAVKTVILKSDPTDYSLYYDKNMAEDWFRSIYLLTAAEKTVYINKHLYNYRTNEQSISRSFRPETIKKRNILYVYDRFTEYLPKWGMDTKEYRQKLNARWLDEVMYTFSTYYENVRFSERKSVLTFNWNSMLPSEARLETDNPYENKVYRKLYSHISKKNFLYIRLFFLKKKTRKFLRKLLKRGI